MVTLIIIDFTRIPNSSCKLTKIGGPFPMNSIQGMQLAKTVIPTAGKVVSSNNLFVQLVLPSTRSREGSENCNGS